MVYGWSPSSFEKFNLFFVEPGNTLFALSTNLMSHVWFFSILFEKFNLFFVESVCLIYTKLQAANVTWTLNKKCDIGLGFGKLLNSLKLELVIVRILHDRRSHWSRQVSTLVGTINLQCIFHIMFCSVVNSLLLLIGWWDLFPCWSSL